MPIDAAREDIVEDLFWRVRMERWERSQEFVTDYSQCPLEFASTLAPVRSRRNWVESRLTQSTPSPTPTPRMLSGATYY
jgi:hypothetical protein